MWLDLAEMRLILAALERQCGGPEAGPVDVAATRALRDYFREQVARVQRVADDWERRRTEVAEEGAR